MLAKVFNTTLNGFFRAQPNILSNHFTFCTNTTQRHESHPLRNKIMGLSSFDEFNTFFKDKSKQFDASCYSMASRTLAKILIESRLVFNFAHRESLKAYLSNLQKVDIEAMNLQQFSQLLYLLRVLKHDPVNNNNFVRQYIRSIFDRSEPKLKELESETSLNRLSYFYQEYSSLGGKQASVLAKRINQFIRSNNPEVEAQYLTMNEINLILKGMRSKKFISFDEILLFKNVIKTVSEKYFDKISFFQLAQISVGVNEINSLNTNDIVPFGLMDQIHRKVLTNIDEMDEKSIMYILNGQKTPNKVYSQIYRVIFEKILDEIQPNGQSSFNELFTLRLFNGISNKIRLQSATPENQEKFFAFFRQAITKTPRFIHSFLETYVENGFFNNKHLLRVLEILQSIPDFNYKLTLLHALAKRRINIQKITNIDLTKEIEVKEKNLIMLIFIVESIIEQNPIDKQNYIDNLAKMKARFFDLYKVEDDSFSKLMIMIPNNLIETLSRGLRREIEQKLPNPFETEQSEKYRAAWLKLQVFGNNEMQFSKKYGPALKDKVTAVDLNRLLKTLSYVGYSNNDSISNALNLITKRFDLLLNDDELLRSIASLMQNEIAGIFEQGNSELIKNRYWNVLNECFEKLEPTKFFATFNPVIILILKLATYDFVYSSQYQSFLLKVLQKAEHIKNRNLPSDLLEECLKLNLVKRADIPNLSPNVLENLHPSQKLILKMIETNDFALEGVELSRNNLYLYLHNNAKQTKEQLFKNRQKILNIISEMKVKDIWKCLIHYRLGPKKNEAELVEALLKQMSKFKLRYEEYSPVFIAQVFKRNNLDKAFVKLDGIKAFFKSSMDYFADRRNLGKIPLQDHLEIIKSANDFKVRSESYVHQIFNYYHGDLNFFMRELYLLAGNLGISLNKKEMERLIEVNFFTGFNASFSKCLNIFLLNENDIPTPREHLKTIIAKFNELSSHEKVPIYSLYYEYLKKAYPEETKDWQPNQVEKADFSRSLQALNSRNLTWFRQIVEEVTQQKWVENVVSNNYYYTFRNLAITFPYQTKYFGENNLMRKVMSSLTGVEKVIVLNKRQTSLKSAMKYILQIDQKLFSTVQEADILKKFEQKIEQSKAIAGEEEAEDVAEETAKEEKAKN